MKPATILRLRRRMGAVARIGAVLIAGAWLGQATSATLADAPLFTASTTPISPNLMFILDDSGSMQWDFMPDDADVLNRTMFGRTSTQCNGLAYDPKSAYTPPYAADASNAIVQVPAADITTWTKPDPTIQTVDQVAVKSISAAPIVGSTTNVSLTTGGMFFDLRNAGTRDTVTVFKDATNYFIGQVEVSDYATPLTMTLRVVAIVGSVGSGTVTGYKVGKGEPVPGTYNDYTATTKQPRLSWDNADGTLNSTSTFYKECTTLVSAGSTQFTKVTVSSLATADQQNYANWAKFYRTRIMAMKSGSSVAFSSVSAKYRVGYSAISEPNAKTGLSQFLHVDTFEKAQKASFFNMLNAAAPGSSGTPLRGALAKAGQYFANKALGQDKDPMQYSCQRNFAILSTDGYWNEGGNTGQETQLTCSTDASGKTTCSVKARTSPTGYGPFQFDRATPVLNVDGSLPRPMADGDTLTSTTTKTWSDVKTGKYSFVTGSDLVKSTTVSKTTSGNVRQVQQTVNYKGASCASSKGVPVKWYQMSKVQRQYITGTRTRAQVSEARSRTIRTVVVQRSQQTDYVETIVVTNGATMSDKTTSKLGSTTDTPVSDTTAAPVDLGTKVLPATDVTNETGASGWVDSGTPTQGLCVSSPTVSTSSPPTNVATNLLANDFSNPTTSPGTPPDRTEPYPASEGWVATPTTASTDPLSTTDYQSKNGSYNTLADVAAFYYENDLRTSTLNNCTGVLGKDVCENNVPGTPLTDPYKSFGDSAHTQHMTTFTLGLGVSGSLRYDPNYINMRSGDFHDIVSMAKNWPNTVAGANTTVDDLWHAAVDGRGQYFSAGSPAALTAGLNTALAAIDTVIGSASAASTSSLQPVTGDNDIFVAQFTTKEWTGDVLAYKIDPNTGRIPKTTTWSAQAQLEAKDYTTRKILYNSPAAKGLTDFTYANLKTDSLNQYFDNFCGKPSLSGAGIATPNQCATLLAADQTLASNGTNLVNYLRGDQTMTYYRTRTKRLGDIINASPLFVGKPAFKYPDTENSYQVFAKAKVARTAVVLAAANDGMLHAFDRAKGNELWAFVPTAVIPELHKLADTNFQNNHQYFVDGSPQMGDIWDPTLKAWRTIVVGGLNKGGRSYYALDVTDPTTPTLMWEYSANNLGYTFGNPIITKRKDGTWVVVFASGYENVNSADGTYLGDGNGHLFVIDAVTGKDVISGGVATLDPKGNAVGTTASPSGLAKINSWVDDETDNTSKRFYGGDELGNVWRFDIDGIVDPKNAALQLAQLQVKDASGVMQAQPITTRPAVAQIQYNGTNYPVVYVGTGSYIRQNDSKNTLVQSVYAIKDPMDNTAYGDVHARSDMQVQTITAGVDNKQVPTRSSTSLPVDWSKKIGWRADFPVGGERVSVAPQLALDTLYIGSNLPNDQDCSVGGNSFLYQFNILTGESDSVFIGNVLVQGLTLVQLTTGANAGSIVGIITRSDGSLQTEVGDPPAVTGILHRSSWRELVD